MEDGFVEDKERSLNEAKADDTENVDSEFCLHACQTPDMDGRNIGNESLHVHRRGILGHQE